MVKEALPIGFTRQERSNRIFQKKDEPYKVELMKILPEGRRDDFLSARRIC